MKRWMLMAAAALAVAACTEKGILEPRDPNARPRATIVYYPTDSIFRGSPTPTQVLDATGGWEVGTVFTTDDTVMVTGVRFYKAAGETGTHTVNIWSSGGTKLAFKTFTSETSSGWQTASINSILLTAGTYVVSFNTNTWQGKTPLFGFPLYRTKLTATGGRWISGVGNFPTNNSASAFFADLIYRAKNCNDAIDSPCP